MVRASKTIIIDIIMASNFPRVRNEKENSDLCIFHAAKTIVQGIYYSVFVCVLHYKGNCHFLANIINAKQ